MAFEEIIIIRLAISSNWRNVNVFYSLQGTFTFNFFLHFFISFFLSCVPVHSLPQKAHVASSIARKKDVSRNDFFNNNNNKSTLNYRWLQRFIDFSSSSSAKIKCDLNFFFVFFFFFNHRAYTFRILPFSSLLRPFMNWMDTKRSF